MRPFDYQLLTIAVEPNARKKVAKANSILSGTIPVLASVAFRAFPTDNRTAQEVYAANMGAKTLVRRYLALLVRAGLVVRNRYYKGLATLSLTPEGHQVVGQYERALRDGCRSFGGTIASRVLTR